MATDAAGKRIHLLQAVEALREPIRCELKELAVNTDESVDGMQLLGQALTTLAGISEDDGEVEKFMTEAYELYSKALELQPGAYLSPSKILFTSILPTL